jgi:hypothetical protein
MEFCIHSVCLLGTVTDTGMVTIFLVLRRLQAPLQDLEGPLAAALCCLVIPAQQAVPWAHPAIRGVLLSNLLARQMVVVLVVPKAVQQVVITPALTLLVVAVLVVGVTVPRCVYRTCCSKTSRFYHPADLSEKAAKLAMISA